MSWYARLPRRLESSIMKISTIALVSVLVLGSAGLANAEPSLFARAPIEAWHGQHFTIIRLDQFEPYDSFRVAVETSVEAYPEDVAAMQDSIRANRSLATALRSHGVQLVNVVAIKQGFDGNLVFYLR
jgi:hypothetical protein